MRKIKPYKEQEPMVPNVGEPVVVYTGNENNPNIVTKDVMTLGMLFPVKNYWIDFALV